MADDTLLQLLLQGVDEWNEWNRNRLSSKRPDLSGADLSGASLSGVDFSGVDLPNANLSRAELVSANLYGAVLSGANLSGANLHAVNLYGADLSKADLTGACLFQAALSEATLFHTTFHSAEVAETIFSKLDLRGAEGLETVIHFMPSEVGIRTIYKSKGVIPETFLRGCGVPESFITQIPALTAAIQPIQFYSCFISYNNKDEELAQRLHADLQSKGVRCWFAPEDLKIGERFRRRIDEVIRVYDRLLLILSENSVASSWVEKEVETAMESEDEQRRTILFPVRIDDSVMEIKEGWPADVRRTRHIGDFRRWKEHDEYRKAFKRLLNDLRASA
jgi:uncharacterized protein YjbI with pentapeptide repeats